MRKIAGISKDDYSSAIDRIIDIYQGNPISIEQIEQVDLKMANIIKKFLSNDESDENKHNYLLTSRYHNEALISAPTIKGIYTKDISLLPDEYLDYAENNNLPIVITSG